MHLREEGIVRPTGIAKLDPKQFPKEYYKLTDVAKASGFSARHLRRCALRKYPFTNADWIRVSEFNRYVGNPGAAEFKPRPMSSVRDGDAPGAECGDSSPLAEQ